jgi:hypothetical protein
LLRRGDTYIESASLEEEADESADLHRARRENITGGRGDAGVAFAGVWPGAQPR